MNSKARRAKCIEMAYDYIKRYGPCAAGPILVEVNKEFGGLVTMSELAKYLAYLHSTGKIEGERTSGSWNVWRVVEA